MMPAATAFRRIIAQYPSLSALNAYSRQYCYITSKSKATSPTLKNGPGERPGELIWRYCEAPWVKDAGRKAIGWACYRTRTAAKPPSGTALPLG